MTLNLDIYNSICAAKAFSINGVKAYCEDFGELCDTAHDEKKPYCCGNMVFKPRTRCCEILQKYGISEEEYTYICIQLRKKLSFGMCRNCV